MKKRWKEIKPQLSCCYHCKALQCGVKVLHQLFWVLDMELQAKTFWKDTAIKRTNGLIQLFGRSCPHCFSRLSSGLWHSKSNNPWNSTAVCAFFLSIFFLSFLELPTISKIWTEGMKLVSSVAGTKNHVQNLKKKLFFLESKKHIYNFSVERQAWWFYQHRLWFCFGRTSLILQSTRCWAVGRTWSCLQWCAVGGKKINSTNLTWTLHVVRGQVRQQKKKKCNPFFLLLDGIPSTLEQHDLTLINAESYQGLKAASQAAHIPCVFTGHWL